MTRRDLLARLGALPVAGAAGEGLARAQTEHRFHHRQLGRTGRWIVPLGLGGQGALQWTPEGVDPVDIVVRAVELGVNYLDTALDYGPSQRQFGRAFRRLRVTPGPGQYNGALRERLFVASKTRARYSVDPKEPAAVTVVSDLKRALSELFGDGKGGIPTGAYLDSMQIEDVASLEDVDRIYEGMEERGRGRAQRFGALAGLLDYRDGTNYTGTNPERRIYLKHVGLTGHRSSLILMNALQRDTEGIFDTLLVALNVNDRRYCAHQYNVLPVAVAKGVGVVAMKAFAGGVFYGRPPRFSSSAEEVIQSVGAENAVSCWDLVRYPVSLAGVACVVTGIGHIDREKPEEDQLAVNLAAATGDLATMRDRVKIEREARRWSSTRTNYFQDPPTGLVQPGEVKVVKQSERLRVSWDTALAGAEPIGSYLIMAGEKVLLSIPFRPQTTLEPLHAFVPAAAVGGRPVTVVASNLPAWIKRPG